MRDNDLHNLHRNLKELGLLYIWNFFNSCNDDTKLCMVLGTSYNSNVMSQSLYSLNGVTIDAQFDSFCKPFLKRAWSYKTALKKQNCRGCMMCKYM